MKINYIKSNNKTMMDLQDRARQDHSVDNNISTTELLNRFVTFKNISTYLIWVIKQYINRHFLFEDLKRVDSELAEFNRIKSKLENKDLNKYTYVELNELLEKYKDVNTKSKRQKKGRY